jgi:hypothetical protein
MKIAAIMPCRGRADQTVANIRRLLATASYDDWELICVADDDMQAAEAITQTDARLMMTGIRQGYWRCLDYATRESDAQYLVNLANDLLPGQHWLRRAVEAYQAQFGPNAGLLGFNGDSHEVGHSCHFLIDRKLLTAFGGWPIWYDHNFGDTELCQRAIAARSYAKAPWALLFHDHPYFGGKDDPTYAEGRASATKDEALYHERKRLGWPSL